jgi:hypothetical protein
MQTPMGESVYPTHVPISNVPNSLNPLKVNFHLVHER